MRALLCPASLKGVLTARDAAAALARGAGSAGADAVELPIADGGEGTSDALHAALGGEWRQAIVSDPLGRPVSARWLLLPDGRAVMEAAAAIGLPLLADDERDPLVASSRGLGELVLAALLERPRALLVGLGGSATVDGGAGLREVLRELSVSTTVLCDVTTTLADAARVFGPQKGATEEGIAILERRLAGMDELLPYAGLPGAGAAGGLGAALAALGAELVPGAPLILDLVGFDEHLRECEIAITGEGQVDATTAQGKAPGVVAARCAASGVRCVVFGGRVVEAIDGVETVSLSGDPARAEADLEELGGRLVASASGIRRREPIGHRLEHLPGDLRARLDERPEHEDRQSVGSDVADGRDRRGARTAIDERDLAEGGARSDRRHGLAVNVDGELAALATKNISPPSPSSANLSPAAKRRSLNSSARLSRSRSSRSENSLTLRRSAGVGFAMGDSYTKRLPRVTCRGRSVRAPRSVARRPEAAGRTFGRALRRAGRVRSRRPRARRLAPDGSRSPRARVAGPRTNAPRSRSNLVDSCPERARRELDVDAVSRGDAGCGAQRTRAPVRTIA